MPTLMDAVKPQMDETVAHYVAVTRDCMASPEKFTLPAFGGILTNALASLMRTVESAGQYKGPEKKTAVLTGIDQLLDGVIDVLVVPGIPPAVQKTLINPVLKNIIRLFASGAVDAMTNIFNRTGWFDVPTPGAPTPPAPGPQPPGVFTPY